MSILRLLVAVVLLLGVANVVIHVQLSSSAEAPHSLAHVLSHGEPHGAQQSISSDSVGSSLRADAFRVDSVPHGNVLPDNSTVLRGHEIPPIKRPALQIAKTVTPSPITTPLPTASPIPPPDVGSVSGGKNRWLELDRQYASLKEASGVPTDSVVVLIPVAGQNGGGGSTPGWIVVLEALLAEFESELALWATLRCSVRIICVVPEGATEISHNFTESEKSDVLFVPQFVSTSRLPATEEIRFHEESGKDKGRDVQITVENLEGFASPAAALLYGFAESEREKVRMNDLAEHTHFLLLPPHSRLRQKRGGSLPANFFSQLLLKVGVGYGVKGLNSFVEVEMDRGLPGLDVTQRSLDGVQSPSSRDIVAVGGLLVGEGRSSVVLSEAYAGYPATDVRVQKDSAVSVLSPHAVMIVSAALLRKESTIVTLVEAMHAADKPIRSAPHDPQNPFSMAPYAGYEPILTLLLQLCDEKLDRSKPLWMQVRCHEVVGSEGFSHDFFEIEGAHQEERRTGAGFGAVRRRRGGGAAAVPIGEWRGIAASSPGVALKDFSKSFADHWEDRVYDTHMSFPVKVIWDTFCIKCFGFTNEVMHYIAPLEQTIRTVRSEQGEHCFCPGSPTSFTQSLLRANAGKQWQQAFRKNHSSWIESDNVLVWVSHKDPGSYTSSHPSVSKRPDYIVGRSMFEATRLDQHWIDPANDNNLVDEIWVPSYFVYDVFKNNNVAESKLYVMPEPIDVHFFSPDAVEPYSLPERHFAQTASTHPGARVPHRDLARHYKFLSVFKLEDRKGWDILLAAYLKEFKADAPVSLYLVCYLWGESDSRNAKKVLEKVLEAAHKMGYTDSAALPHIEVVTSELTETEVCDSNVMKAVGWFP